MTEKEIKLNKVREFFLKSEDIVKVSDFGGFELIFTKTGVMFKTHTGFHVWCTPYVLDLEGKAHENSLYAWLRQLAEAKESYSGEAALEPFEEMENVTKGDILDSMRIITEANMTHPITAFVDMETATQFASKRLAWLGEMQEKLATAMTEEVKEETDADIKANFEHSKNIIELEKLNKVLNGED